MYERISLKGMSEEEWLKLRRSGIGGSDVGAIMGVNKYSSPLSVYRQKTADNIISKTTEATRFGKDMEFYIAQRFFQETGFKPRRSHVMYRSREYPFIIGDIDFMITRRDDTFLECKTTNIFGADEWENGIPERYMFQVQHYMLLLDRPSCFVVCLIPGIDLIIREISRNDELIAEMIAKEKDFWENHVKKRVMPPVDGSKPCDEVIGEYFPKSEKGTVVTLKGYDETLLRRAEIITKIENLEKEKNKLDQSLKLALGEAEIGITDNYKISWSSVDTTRLDTKKLKEEKPDIFSEYSKTTSSRRFQIKVA